MKPQLPQKLSLKMKSKIIVSIGFAGFLNLTSCASQTPESADYNGDGVISNVEYDQFSKRKTVEAVNMQNENNQMRNFSDNLQSVQSSMQSIQSIGNMLGY
ncbi:MAG: hypothetical protein QM680_09160 [Luteolibacter sp.]